MIDVIQSSNKIIEYIKILDFSDQVFLWLSLFFWILFLILWFEKLQKAYLWIILGLFLFSLINFSLFSINTDDIWVNSFKQHLYNNKDFYWVYSIYLIPILALFLVFNDFIELKWNSIKLLNYVFSFILWFLFIWFFITINLSIINNRFLFGFDLELIESLKQLFYIEFLFNFFKDSVIYPFLLKYDYILNIIIILFIFYKITIWWIISYMLSSIWRFIKSKFKKKNEEE